MDAYPHTVEDMQTYRVECLTNFAKSIQENCFNACAVNNETTLLTYQEGVCFRNCVTKFGLWYGTFGPASEDAAFR